jgi:hypothetical protein
MCQRFFFMSTQNHCYFCASCGQLPSRLKSSNVKFKSTFLAAKRGNLFWRHREVNQDGIDQTQSLPRPPLRRGGVA